MDDAVWVGVEVATGVAGEDVGLGEGASAQAINSSGKTRVRTVSRMDPLSIARQSMSTLWALRGF